MLSIETLVAARWLAWCLLMLDRYDSATTTHIRKVQKILVVRS